MMNKSMSVEDILEQRGERYGKFEHQIECVGSIVEAMCKVHREKFGKEPSPTLRAEWHYLAIKLARIPADPDYIDNLHDLEGYARLMKEERS